MQLTFKTMSKEEYKKQVIEKVQINRLSLNSLQCINPSNEFKIKLAELILAMLDDREKLLPDGIITESIGEEIANKIPTLYLSISKS